MLSRDEFNKSVRFGEYHDGLSVMFQVLSGQEVDPLNNPYYEFKVYENLVESTKHKVVPCSTVNKKYNESLKDYGFLISDSLCITNESNLTIRGSNQLGENNDMV